MFLSFFVAPYAKQKLSEFKDNAGHRPEFIFLNQNQFQDFENYVFYSPYIETNEGNQVLKNIYLFSDSKNNKIVISAKEGLKYYDSKTKNIYLDLIDGHLYKNLTEKSIGSISSFNSFKFKIYDASKTYDLNQEDKIETSNIYELLKINSNESYAEIFYRISQPILMFTLVLFSLILVGTNARNLKGYSLFLMLLVYIAYNNSIIFTKQLITHDSLNLVLTFLLPHSIFIGIMILLKIMKNRIFA